MCIYIYTYIQIRIYVFKPENSYFASRPGLEVKPQGVFFFFGVYLEYIHLGCVCLFVCVCIYKIFLFVCLLF